MLASARVPAVTARCRHPQRYRLRSTLPDQTYCSKCERYLAAPRVGAGHPPVRGVAQRERLHLKLTEAELAEIQVAAGEEPLGPWIIEAALRRARGGR
jgi:hypothetical protein